MVKVPIHGLMAVYTMVTGKITKCTAKECSPGPMEENMKESIMMIKSKVMAFFTGRMDDSTTVSGWLESNKASVFTSTPKVRYAMAAGKMESA